MAKEVRHRGPYSQYMTHIQQPTKCELSYNGLSRYTHMYENPSKNHEPCFTNVSFWAICSVWAPSNTFCASLWPQSCPIYLCKTICNTYICNLTCVEYLLPVMAALWRWDVHRDFPERRVFNSVSGWDLIDYHDQ